MFATSESLWVLLPNNDAVVRVDFASSEVGDRFGVGDRPTLIGFADARLWIANAGDATVTPIEPPDGVLQPVELPDVAVAMINHGNDALVATADGRLLVLSPSATGGTAEEIAQIDEEPPLRLRLLSAGNLVWVWQPGSSFLWGVDRGAQNSLIRHEAPFPLEKLGLFDGSLWGFSRDGAVVRLSATDASLEDDLGSIEGRPSVLLKDEEKARLLVITEDGSVYRIAS
jgi:hypothetical protein